MKHWEPINREFLEEQYVEAGLSMTVLAKQLKIDKRIVKFSLLTHGIPLKRHGAHNRVDISGQRFGRLQAIEQVPSLRCTSARWRCLCDCGTEKEVMRNSLVSGATRSCGCLFKEVMFQGQGELSKSYWDRIVRGAHKRGLEMAISIVDAWKLFLVQGKQCALSGIPITIVSDYTRKHHLHTASLDRKDHRVGYRLSNVHWVHRDINMMRRTRGIELFLDYCRRIAHHEQSAKIIR